MEVLVSTAAVRDCIMNKEKTIDIPELIEQGGQQYGMVTFDQSIMRLYRSGLISFEEAMNQCSNPDDFDLRVKGITGAADRWDKEETTDVANTEMPAPEDMKKF